MLEGEHPNFILYTPCPEGTSLLKRTSGSSLLTCQLFFLCKLELKMSFLRKKNVNLLYVPIVKMNK